MIIEAQTRFVESSPLGLLDDNVKQTVSISKDVGYELNVIHSLDGTFCLGILRKTHEAKATTATCITIFNDGLGQVR